MKKLTCFVIIPSNRDGKPVRLLQDDRYGLVEFPSGCRDQNSAEIVLDFDDVYEQIIEHSIKQVNEEYQEQKLFIECIRAQDLPLTGDIIGQLLRYICAADITVTDITTNNPNVLLEYGIRLVVKDELNIMLCHENTKLPFDIEKLRCIYYAMGIKAANQAKSKIIDFLRTYIQNNFLHQQKKQEMDTNIFGSGNFSFYKQHVEMHTGRQLERRLVDVLAKAPTLIADLGSFLLTNEKRPGLKQDLFKFLDSVEEIYKNNPGGQEAVIEHLELISKIKGLTQDRLQDIYYKLWDICNANPDFKNKADKYLDNYKKLEE